MQTKYQTGDMLVDKSIHRHYLVLEVAITKSFEPSVYKLLCVETGRQLPSLIHVLDRDEFITREV